MCKGLRNFTVIWHSEYAKRTTNSSLLPSEMIAKLERTQNTEKTRTKTKKKHNQWEQHQTMNKQQQNQHVRKDTDPILGEA